MGAARTKPILRWSWFVFASLLALRFNWQITEKLGIPLELDWFLPLFAGWSAHRYGAQVFKPLLGLGVLAVFGLTLSPTFDIWISFGFSPDAYLLAGATAIAFARPDLTALVAVYFQPWWRRAVGLAVVALAAKGFVGDSLAVSSREGFKVEFDPGVALAVLALAAAIRWRDAAIRIHSVWAEPHRPLCKVFAVALAVIAVLTLFVNADYSRGESFRISVNAGLSYSRLLLPACCFIVAGARILDWRFLIGLLAASFAVGWLGSPSWARLHEALWATASAPGETDFQRTAEWSLLVPSVSATLIGVVLSSFWRQRELAPLRNWRTPLVLVLILVGQFFIIPLVYQGQPRPYWANVWIPAATAFTAGLVWRGQGVWGATLIILLSYVACLAGFSDEQMRAAPEELVRLALIAFPFAFFGLLSNRYECSREPDRVGAVTTAPREITSASKGVDITPLARIVRRLDISATLKAFAAVMAPLVVLHNLALLSAGIVGFLVSDVSFSENLAFVGAYLAIGGMAVLAPLGFVVGDWVARKDEWRYLAAITGAILGGVGFAAAGALGGFVADEFLENDPNIRLTAAILFLQAGVGSWLIAGSRRVRRSLILVATMAVIATTAVVGGVLWRPIADWRSKGGHIDPDEMTSSIGGLFLVGFGVWWLVRAVRLRVVLSGDRPRSLLLGELHRRGFWVRVAFLMGLPSSLWNLAALRTAAFWSFMASRGLVFVGFQLLFTDTYSRYGETFRLAAAGKARVGFGLFLLLGGHIAFYLGKRLTARYCWIPKSTADPRPPVLFLRSFEDDQFAFPRRPWDLVGRWFDLWSFRRNADEALVDEVAQYGPVVALGRPGEKRTPFGASRYYSSHQDWQALITETARRARAVVICAGTSPGVRWEYGLLAREQLLDRTVLLFRSVREGDPSNRETLEAFRSGTSWDALPDFPPTENLVALIPTSDGPLLVRAARPTAASYVLALRAHFQRRGATELADPALV